MSWKHSAPDYPALKGLVLILLTQLVGLAAHLDLQRLRASPSRMAGSPATGHDWKHTHAVAETENTGLLSDISALLLANNGEKLSTVKFKWAGLAAVTYDQTNALRL